MMGYYEQETDYIRMYLRDITKPEWRNYVII